MKEDLSQYSDSELSMRVMNDEALYNLRRYPQALQEAITNLFHFTPAQFAELSADIADEINGR